MEALIKTRPTLHEIERKLELDRIMRESLVLNVQSIKLKSEVGPVVIRQLEKTGRLKEKCRHELDTL